MSAPDCVEVDDFIVSYKTLVGLMPPWTDYRDRDFQVRWGIADKNEVQRAELVIVSNGGGSKITFIALFRQCLIYRLDVEPLGRKHPNPFGAHLLGLPVEVDGTHVHDWQDNRAYVEKNGFGLLPYRRPVEGRIDDLADGLAWTAHHLGISVSGEQRACDAPPRGLF